MSHPPLVLGSTSPYRRELLDRLGVPFECVAPGVDENGWKSPGARPDDVARALAVAKARAVSTLRPGAVVIGSDQVCEIDGQILGQPGTVEAAIDQLARLSGRTHRLLTAMAIIDGRTGAMTVDLDEHRMTMRALTRDALARYVAHDDPVRCAGSYRIEAQGIALFERIEGRDFTAIVGLSLTTVVARLGALGIDVLG